MARLALVWFVKNMPKYEAIGGVSRMAFQMSSAARNTAGMQRSIELLGAEVAPMVRGRMLQ